MNTALLVTLSDRLTAAAALLLGHGHRDSSAAVRESQELLQVSAGPKGEDLSALRELRQWHFDQYHEYSRRANEMEKKAASRTFQADSRSAFERTADGYRKIGNQHLRFVRNMNVLFPKSDKVM
jgi:hypothetical protein